ncbi:MAG: hypothetical protein HY286_09740 [Planctomycetes bacterium]|nr:hypothetical protein [Planctomycetota bacterium]
MHIPVIVNIRSVFPIAVLSVIIASCAQAPVAGRAREVAVASNPAKEMAPIKREILKLTDTDTEANDLARASSVEVENLRKLKFRDPVKKAMIDKRQLSAFLEADRKEESDPDSERADQLAFELFGMLKPGQDLRKIATDLMSDDVAGFYDPRLRALFLLKEHAKGGNAKQTMVHELCHALEDQYYHFLDVEQALDRVDKNNNDRRFAWSAVCEGSATLLMFRWQIGAMFDGAKAEQIEEMDATDAETDAETAVESDTADLNDDMNAEDVTDMSMDADDEQVDEDELTSMIEEIANEENNNSTKVTNPKADAGFGGEFGRAGVDYAAVPPIVLRPILYRYLVGGSFLNHGSGWLAKPSLADLDYAFNNPPRSSEQVLHPDKYWNPDLRDEPIAVRTADVTDILGKNWKKVGSNVLGELGVAIWTDDSDPAETPADKSMPFEMSIIFKQTSTIESEGWGGDLYTVYENGAGAAAMVFASVSDREIDAKQIHAALHGGAGIKIASRIKGDRVVAVFGRAVDASILERIADRSMATFETQPTAPLILRH